MKDKVDDRQIAALCEKFQIAGEYRFFEVVSRGHINDTYKVFYFRDNMLKDYILQRVNTNVFKNPVEIMNNISHVTEFIRAKIKLVKETAKRDVLHFMKTAEGKYYHIDDKGGFWRCCRFIDDSVVFDTTDNTKAIYEAGKAFGEFQRCLDDYPVEKLYIAIPHFHNTVKRYENFKKAVSNDFAGRAHLLDSEINDYLALEEVATKMYRMQQRGELPLRVTHNDTKCNNVLFDKNTFVHLAVVDLDTVMPGLAAFDFGDSIRFIANSAAEDEEDITKVSLDMDKYTAYAEGFMTAVRDLLTENEKSTMALGAVTMTIECGVRFLTDYLDGDKYFKTNYPEHNLVRSRCQLALAKDMLKKYDRMQEIIRSFCE